MGGGRAGKERDCALTWKFCPWLHASDPPRDPKFAAVPFHRLRWGATQSDAHDGW